MSFFTYKLIEPKSGRFYVGSTGRYDERIRRHFRELENGKHHNALMQELWDAGERFVIDRQEFVSREEALVEEGNIISANLDNPLLLNISMGVNGGDNLSRNPQREDIIDRMAVTIRQLYADSVERRSKHSQPGELNGMFGRTHTAEARARMSEAMFKRVPRRGFHLTDEVKAKLSAAAKLRTGEKNSFHGKTHSEETVSRIVEATRQFYERTGKPYPNSRPVSVDGVEYPSSVEAARALKINRSLFGHRLRSRLAKYQNYRYADKSPTTIETALGEGEGSRVGSSDPKREDSGDGV